MVKLASTDYAGANHTHLSEVAPRPGGHRPQSADGAPHPGQGGHPEPTETASLPNTGCAVSGCLRRECSSRSTAAIIRGWRNEVHGLSCCWAVDDATGIVANAVFRPEEDTRGYFILIQGLIERWGVPLALYCDRHGGVQVFRKASAHLSAGEGHPLQPGHGGTGHPADIRPLAASQGPSGTDGGNLPGPAGDRTALSWHREHRRGQRHPAGLHATLQRPVCCPS